MVKTDGQLHHHSQQVREHNPQEGFTGDKFAKAAFALAYEGNAMEMRIAPKTNGWCIPSVHVSSYAEFGGHDPICSKIRISNLCKA